MENEQQFTDRLDQVTTLLERALAWLEERSGEVERISATVDAAISAREQELAEKLAAAEGEIAQLRAAGGAASETLPARQAPARKTIPASTTEMLAKHGIGEGPVDVRSLDAALAGLSLEQRIAVKSQLLRAGAIA